MHQLIAQISLIHGWFPVVVQLGAALLLGIAVGVCGPACVLTLNVWVGYFPTVG